MRVTLALSFFAMIFLACAADDGGLEAVCGDGVCSGDETPSSCATDCSVNGPRCGDGVCNGNESASSCATDCGASACSTSPDNCTGETICIAGSCTAAFPRVYTIRNVAVSVPTRNPADNSEWDAGAGPPDMYLQSGATELTDPVQDQFSATFPGPFEFSLIGGATLRLDVYDFDVTSDDYVTACQWAPVTAAMLRSRKFACAGSGITFTSSITPK